MAVSGRGGPSASRKRFCRPGIGGHRQASRSGAEHLAAIYAVDWSDHGSHSFYEADDHCTACCYAERDAAWDLAATIPTTLAGDLLDLEPLVCDTAGLAAALAMAVEGIDRLGIEDEHQQRALQCLANEAMHAAEKVRELWYEIHKTGDA